MSNEVTTGSNAPQTGTVEVNSLPPDSNIVVFGHRSGAETHMVCPRRYYLNYEYLGMGIVPDPGPLYFAVGTAVHHGLANMLLAKSINECVNVAIDSLCESPAWQAIENPDLQNEQLVLVEGLLYAFYVYAYPGMRDNFEVLCVETGAVEYVPIEVNTANCDLCDSTGIAKGVTLKGQTCAGCNGMGVIKTYAYIAIQSRPDAILRNKQTGEVAGISWKTIDDPTDMRRSQLVNDLQGFMEMYYGEKILEKLAGAPVTTEEIQAILRSTLSPTRKPLDIIHSLQEGLSQLEKRARAARNIPTTIDYIQTIFLVKGPRKLLLSEDNPLVGEVYGNETMDEYGGYQPGKVYKQASHLCYRYRNPYHTGEIPEVELYKTGPKKGTPKPVDNYDPNLYDEAWTYRFYKPGNATGSALNTKWLSEAIRPDEIRDWVDRLNSGSVYPSCLQDERNVNPIAKLVRFEEPLYKDQLTAERHVNQQKDRFVRIARAKDEMEAGIENAGMVDKQLMLDVYWPQHLISCRTPYRCAYHDFCHSAKSNEIDFVNLPEGFTLRTPHHELERELRENVNI